jgi:protein-tyrosine-phosphatase
MALYYLKASREFNAAVREWENRPAVNKTWQSIKPFISAEHAKGNKQNKLTAKNFKANMIEEQEEATEELIAALTEKHTQQIESLIKSNTEAMKQMMSLIKNDRKEPGDKQQPDEEKKKKREERRQRLNNDTDEMNDEIEQINIIPVKQPIKNTKSKKWTRRMERRRLVIDSGATSNFVPEEMNLPRMGKSNKEVYLPDEFLLPSSLSSRAA